MEAPPCASSLVLLSQDRKNPTQPQTSRNISKHHFEDNYIFVPTMLLEDVLSPTVNCTEKCYKHQLPWGSKVQTDDGSSAIPAAGFSLRNGSVCSTVAALPGWSFSKSVGQIPCSMNCVTQQEDLRALSFPIHHPQSFRHIHTLTWEHPQLPSLPSQPHYPRYKLALSLTKSKHHPSTALLRAFPY